MKINSLLLLALSFVVLLSSCGKEDSEKDRRDMMEGVYECNKEVYIKVGDALTKLEQDDTWSTTFEVMKNKNSLDSMFVYSGGKLLLNLYDIKDESCTYFMSVGTQTTKNALGVEIIRSGYEYWAFGEDKYHAMYKSIDKELMISFIDSVEGMPELARIYMYKCRKKE